MKFINKLKCLWDHDLEKVETEFKEALCGFQFVTGFWFDTFKCRRCGKSFSKLAN